MLKKVQCNEQRWPKATLPESAKHEESPDHPQIDLEDPTRAIKKSELRDESSFLPGDGLGAKGKATMIHGDSQQAHALPCPIHHVEKRTCHREGHHDGKDPKNEGQRSR